MYILLPANLSQVLAYLEAIVCPTAKLHDTCLLVKREVLDVYLAGGLVDGRRLPLHQAVEPDRGLGGKGHLEIAVSTEREKMLIGFRSYIFIMNSKGSNVIFGSRYVGIEYHEFTCFYSFCHNTKNKHSTYLL